MFPSGFVSSHLLSAFLFLIEHTDSMHLHENKNGLGSQQMGPQVRGDVLRLLL